MDQDNGVAAVLKRLYARFVWWIIGPALEYGRPGKAVVVDARGADPDIESRLARAGRCGVQQIELRADSRAVVDVFDGLLADLADAPLQVRELALDFIDRSPELVRLEQGAATGAGVPVLFVPSQRLLDLVAAVRTRDLEFLRVK